MKSFKFFEDKLEHNAPTIQYVRVITCDTNQTFSIPIDLYGSILEKGVELYNGHDVTELPTSITDFTIGSEAIGYISYQYIITSLTMGSYVPARINIQYSIRFPGTETYYRFKTVQRVY